MNGGKIMEWINQVMALHSKSEMALAGCLKPLPSAK